MDIVEVLREVWVTVLQRLGGGFLSLLAGLLILVVGYLVARFIASVVQRLLRRTKLDNRVAQAMGGDTSLNLEELVGRIVFYVLLFVVFIAFLQTIRLEFAAAPLRNMLDSIFTFLPNLLSAGILFLLAWILATIARTVVAGGYRALRLDDRLTKVGALPEGERISLGDTLATVVFALVILLFLPTILDALQMEGLLQPVQDMFTGVLGYIPNLFGAVLIFVIGLFVARVLRQIVTNVLVAVGADRVAERVGLGGTISLSQLAGTLVYTLVMLPVIIQALAALEVAAISGPATGMLNTLLAAIPGIFGAAIVLGISYFVARLVSNLVADLLAGVGTDRLPAALGIQMRGERSLSQLVGYLILVVIMLFAAIEAANLLGFVDVAGIITELVGFGGQVVLGIIILAIGLYLANLVRRIILETGQSNLMGNIARVAILVLAGAMALRQIGLADDIVNLAFGIVLGALAVAAALAFGLGSREIAGREVESILANIRGNRAAEE